jgi:hypothetical protein
MFSRLAWIKCQGHNQSMKCGYARVSTGDQSIALQLAALKLAGTSCISRAKAYQEPLCTLLAQRMNVDTSSPVGLL